MVNLSPCLLRGISMSPQLFLLFQIGWFLALSTRYRSRRVRLSRDLLSAAADERQSCLDNLGGHHIQGRADPPQTIDFTIKKLFLRTGFYEHLNDVIFSCIY